ncbi:unnamed protein product [Protopolystoma xenopodis]|uniref:TLC domain-containing protein n=1 Tax=Protopolystoma xenopodis TaxID=117903 RepID=A0A448X7P9_9PLAT|nr:unnamed protein product [Protopolystoma xenopodis]
MAFLILFYLRLYLYPRRVLHITNWCVYILHKGGHPRFYLVINVLLISLQFMHIYWSWFILKLCFRVLTGRMKELSDIREENEPVLCSKPDTKTEVPSMSSNCHEKNSINGVITGKLSDDCSKSRLHLKSA